MGGLCSFAEVCFLFVFRLHFHEIHNSKGTVFVALSKAARRTVTQETVLKMSKRGLN